MQDTYGRQYVEIAEYPDDPYWRIGSLHLVHGEVGEVIRHGRCPDTHSAFAELVILSEATGIPLSSGDYEILIEAEGPVLRFADGAELWYPGRCAMSLVAITGHDLDTWYRKQHPEGATDA